MVERYIAATEGGEAPTHDHARLSTSLVPPTAEVAPQKLASRWIPHGPPGGYRDCVKNSRYVDLNRDQPTYAGGSTSKERLTPSVRIRLREFAVPCLYEGPRIHDDSVLTTSLGSSWTNFGKALSSIAAVRR
ncbi:hypothetical protein D3C77_144850 [compost metagenome]